MRLLFLILSLTFTANTYALGGFDSLGESEKKILSQIEEQLGFKDPSNKIKSDIYNAISYVFESQWNSYWFGLTDLSKSKLTTDKNNGFYELTVNNKNNGTIFATFIYKPEVKQITIITRQVRHSTRKPVLERYQELKNNEAENKLIHETDNYALVRKKDYVDFSYFHLNSDTASVVYLDMRVIDVE